MPRQLRYIAQAFTNDRPGPPYPFLCAVDAEAGAAILARSADGAMAFQQWADLEVGVYEEPEILIMCGRVPRAALMIDPEGRDPWLVDVA